MVGKGWQVAEGPDFERGALSCGGLANVEEIIAPIKLGLHRNPEGFHRTKTQGIWIARTKLRMNGPDIQLSHCVWFRLHPEDRIVTMLWVEVTQPENMNWDEDWEIPF